MKFWKDTAHLRTLLLYLLVGCAFGALGFYYDRTTGIVVSVLCLMFTVLRLTADAVRDARVRALSRRVAEMLTEEVEGGKPTPPKGSRGALYELDGHVYKLALKLSDCQNELSRGREAQEKLLRGIAGHVILRAEELPANVHRRELIALAHDMENLAALSHEPVPQEQIVPASAADVWNDALIMAEETLRLQHISSRVEANARAYVTTCPRPMLVSALRGLLETCARHAAVGSAWTCSAKQTPVFTEFRISCDRFDWNERELSEVFTVREDAEPALVYLARLAMIYSGEVRTERSEDGMAHLVFRLYQPTR